MEQYEIIEGEDGFYVMEYEAGPYATREEADDYVEIRSKELGLSYTR